MGIFEPVQVALVEGYWRVKVNVSADAAEYVTDDRAMTLAEELESEGWRESAVQIRKAAEAARRFQSPDRAENERADGELDRFVVETLRARNSTPPAVGRRVHPPPMLDARPNLQFLLREHIADSCARRRCLREICRCRHLPATLGCGAHDPTSLRSAHPGVVRG